MPRVEFYFRALDPDDGEAFKAATRWWRPHHTRKRATFRAGRNDTLKLLEAELERAGVTEAVMEIVTARANIRNDGWYRGSAVIREPAVTLWVLKGKHGQQRYPCDRFRDWFDNIRAIALSLEALRMVDRFGVTEHGEQYAGFKALPAPGADTFANADEALTWMMSVSGREAGTWKEHYRSAAAKLHPDSPTGDAPRFVKLQAAKALLEASEGCDVATMMR